MTSECKSKIGPRKFWARLKLKLDLLAGGLGHPMSSHHFSNSLFAPVWSLVLNFGTESVASRGTKGDTPVADICPCLFPTNERDAPSSFCLLPIPFTACSLAMPLMPPRKSKRFRSPSQSESPSTAGASPFSKPSIPTTPASEMDADSPNAATSSKKRAIESDSDDNRKVKPTKRRATAKRVYVEVPASKVFGRGKV